MSFNISSMASLTIVLMMGCQQQPPPNMRSHQEKSASDDGDLGQKRSDKAKDSTNTKRKPGSTSGNSSGIDEDDQVVGNQDDNPENPENTSGNTPPAAPTPSIPDCQLSSGPVSLCWQKVAAADLVGYRVLVSEAGNTVTTQLLKEIELDDEGFDPEKPAYEFEANVNNVIELYAKPCFKIVAFTATGSSPASEGACM